MTVTLELKPEIEKALRDKARSVGFGVNVYLEKLVEQNLSPRESLDSILAPFRREVAESGMSDDEFDEFVQEIRDEVYQEQLAANRG